MDASTTRVHHAKAIEANMPSSEAAREKKRGADPQAAKAAKAAKVAQAAEAAEASEATERDEEEAAQSESGEAEGGAQNEKGVQPGEELGEEQAQGGGAEDEVVKMRLVEDQERFEYKVTEDEFCNVSQVTFTRDGEEIVFERPEDEDSDDWLMWRLMEKGRVAMQRNEVLTRHLAGVAKIVQPYTSREAMTRASATGVYVMPPRIHWRLKTLPERVLKKIEGKYFLTLDQTVSDVHGNKYCPRDDDTGSMCATTGFPHAIAYQRDKGRGKGKSSMEYIVGSCNGVKLNVRLMKRTAVRPTENKLEPATEEEIKNLITSAYTATDMERWGHYENSVLLYAGLEFADADTDDFKPVPASAFGKMPAFNALFAPAESPPYANGFYEFEMRLGVATLKKFKMAKGASTANLSKEHKGRLFRFVIKTLNPFLCGLSGFTVRSLPFVIKGVLHNDAKSQERFVQTDEGIVASPPSDVPAGK